MTPERDDIHAGEERVVNPRIKPRSTGRRPADGVTDGRSSTPSQRYRPDGQIEEQRHWTEISNEAAHVVASALMTVSGAGLGALLGIRVTSDDPVTSSLMAVTVAFCAGLALASFVEFRARRSD